MICVGVRRLAAVLFELPECFIVVCYFATRSKYTVPPVPPQTINQSQIEYFEILPHHPQRRQRKHTSHGAPMWGNLKLHGINQN